MDSRDRRRLATVSDAHALAQFLRVRRGPFSPQTSGYRRPGGGGWRVCGVTRLPRWPALASRTTSASSRRGAAGVR
jgi:hypothetical protein